MQIFRTSLIAFIALSVVTGFIYPAVVTAVAELVFSSQASGSLVSDREGRIAGSSLIGQPFSDAKYFWPRPSATAERPYNPLASGGSQLGPTNPELLNQASARLQAFRENGIAGAVPSDLVLASGSGLDPHITLEAALAQVPRVAKARGLSEDGLRKAVEARLEGRQLMIFGRPRINVLELNLALDESGEGSHGAR